jgi:hypothetical protein
MLTCTYKVAGSLKTHCPLANICTCRTVRTEFYQSSQRNGSDSSEINLNASEIGNIFVFTELLLAREAIAKCISIHNLLQIFTKDCA